MILWWSIDPKLAVGPFFITIVSEAAQTIVFGKREVRVSWLKFEKVDRETCEANC